MGNSSTDEVDPLVEADAYLAHGHDEDAEHILKDAIANDPTRHDLTIKLLDLYCEQRDQVAFYVLAEELYTALGSRGGELWNRVVRLAASQSWACPGTTRNTSANKA
jgi:pilus assembly protein FimV